MACVYLAQDLKHARRVAVKVILPDLAVTVGRDRFLREIEIVAKLHHPNIMPLYDSGDADGLLYFVMPYEPGDSLGDRLRRTGPLGIDETFSMLRDVARALAYAHDHGVVHRDIKPDNVLTAGDAAVVTDFGIAKALTAALVQPEAESITQTGSAIGTAAYMAPEQRLADPTTDHRADIYAFGCLGFEMLTGEPPFAGVSGYQILAAQMQSVAQPLTERRPDVPPALSALLARCLERDPADRPQRATDLLDALRDTTRTSGESVVRPVRSRRWSAVIGAALLLAVVSIWFVASHRDATGPVTLAVLPIRSTGGDSAQALLAEGFGDDIAMALVNVPWVRVMSRQGAANYGGQSVVDPRVAGKALGARYVIVGTLRELEGRRTFTAQLINSSDASVLWADQFDAHADLAALRDRIVSLVGARLRPLGGQQPVHLADARMESRGRNNDAYLLYLVGKRNLSERGSSIGHSIDQFRQAIALDSLYAEAYSGLSLALALAPYFQGVSVASVADEATGSARRALQLDPSLAEPHTALGLVLEHNLEWDRAESEFQAAVTADGHDVEARVQYGRLLLARSRVAAAKGQFTQALADEPASALVHSWVSYAWLVEGRLDSALVESDRAMQSNAYNVSTVLYRGMLLLALGRREDARRLMATAPPYLGPSLYVLARTGDTAIVRERLAQMTKERITPWLESARFFGLLGAGDTAGALDAMELATANREAWPLFGSPADRMYDGVRGSPRFSSALRSMGL
jgi:serine/threonine-protein kinase